MTTAAAATAVAVVLCAQSAIADVARGTIEAINPTDNTLRVGDKTFQWSSQNSLGTPLADLKEGDEIQIRFNSTGAGKNNVQRINLVAASAAMAAPEIPDLANYSTVTEERLTNPEPHNWLLYRGSYAGWGYSPLDEINQDNVADLYPVWTFSTGTRHRRSSTTV